MSAPDPSSRSGLEASRRRWREAWRAEGWHDGRSLADAVASGVAAHGATTLWFHRGERHGGRAGWHAEAHTLAELDERAGRVAAGLHRLGLRRGDAVCAQVPASAENTVLVLAALRLGLVLLPVVSIHGPHELGAIVRSSGARAVVVPARWRGVDHVARVRAIADQGRLEHLIVMGDDAPDDGTAWAVLEAAPGRAPATAAGPDDTVLVVSTSGTTGDPKGVRHTGAGLLASVATGPPSFSSEPRPASLFGSPVGHIGGHLGVLLPFLTGVPGAYLDHWDAEHAAALVERHRLTRSSGAPLHLLGLIEQAEAGVDTSSFWYHCCGGAPVPPTTVERAEALGWRAARGYGASEHPTATSGRDDEPLAARAGTDGRPTPGARLRVVDDEGRDLPTGHDGEILGVGPKLCAGYVDPGHDEEAFTVDGWFRTGDVGHLDGDGRLVVTDRKKDLIIRGGENISSREVEDVLVRHPAVVEAAVVAQPDERYGERACAFVRLRPGAGFSLADARALFVTEGVSRTMTPERVEVVADLPRSPTGKVRKADLRDRLRSEVGAEPF